MLRKLFDATDKEGNVDVGKTDWDWVVQNSTDNLAFLHGAKMFSVGRIMCATTAGYIGRIPHGSAVNDIICVFTGGSVPIVLRDNGDGCYEFIGECYVHGIMDGETMKRDDLTSLSRDFKIR